MLELTQENILEIKGSIVSVYAPSVMLDEVAIIETELEKKIAIVIAIDGDIVKLRLCKSAHGIKTDSKVRFVGRMFATACSSEMYGRIFNGLGDPIGGSPISQERDTPIQLVSYNPEARGIPSEMVRTDIPMIDVFNCLLRSQKIPIFCGARDKYNELLIRIAGQTDADVIVIGGMCLTHQTYSKFVKFIDEPGNSSKTIAFFHKAEDPISEAIIVPDIAISCASKIAREGKNVLVLLTDMSAFADSIKEVAISMDQLPSNRGYPGTLYSDLASRYEQAVCLKEGGSVTIVTATTMPGEDITHPIPDNTGYITEGQIYLKGNYIDPFLSLSRLKQIIIGKKTRKDHGDLANAMIRLYSDAQKAIEKKTMGFELTDRDERLVKYSKSFEENMMSLDIVRSLEDSLDLGWKMLQEFFEEDEVGINPAIMKEFWKSNS